jgi:hypothetical protein
MSKPLSDADRLATLLNSRVPAVRVSTPEEDAALRLVHDAAGRSGARVSTWSVIQGISAGAGLNAEPGTEHPAAALLHWTRQAERSPGVLVALDLLDHVSDARVARALRELVERLRALADAAAAQTSTAHRAASSTLVLIDHAASVPPPVQALAAPFELSLPGDGAIEEQIRRTVRRLHREHPVDVKMSRGTLDSVVKNLRGLTLRQVHDVIAGVVSEDRAFNDADVPGIIAGKRRALAGAGLLEYVESPASLDQIGGLARLKGWLAARKHAFLQAGSDDLPAPRGVLLLGVQGAGKSLSAKAIATAWQRPLLRMDAGALYDKYVGESERKLRDALRQADAMAPVILWIDEIEKAFAGASSHSSDGGLSRRMFGTLLTWMQERTSSVFLVATANDIEALPPELMRKGRFDEIFFVDLPDEEVRRTIFSIHLGKRRLDPAGFDLAALARASAGFSGAEIEQAVLAGLHEARHAKAAFTTEHVLAALRSSPPLSVTMAERIEALRAWSRGRCTPAG